MINTSNSAATPVVLPPGGEAGHEALSDGIDQEDEDDGDRAGRLLCATNGHWPGHNEDIDPTLQELGDGPGTKSGFPLVQRYSRITVLPSIQPSSRRLRRND